MTPPPPVPITADEYEHGGGDGPPARWLAPWTTIRRWLELVGALVIIAAVAGLVGYAVGRHSVAPRPGEEARLDEFDKRVKATIDSARRAAEWEHAQRILAEQRAAALPRVEIREPGVLVIRPVGDDRTEPHREPHIVVVPVEITQAIDAERRVAASLRAELVAREGEAEAERARGDSLQRARDLARAVRYPWIVAGVGGGREASGRWAARVDVGVRLSDRWSLRADVTRALGPGEGMRALVYARREVVSWP